MVTVAAMSMHVGRRGPDGRTSPCLLRGKERKRVEAKRNLMWKRSRGRVELKNGR